jgi:hypothetical protein
VLLRRVGSWLVYSCEIRHTEKQQNDKTKTMNIWKSETKFDNKRRYKRENNKLSRFPDKNFQTRKVLYETLNTIY